MSSNTLLHITNVMIFRNEIDENNQQYAPMAEGILKEMLDLLTQKGAELTAQEFFIIRVKLQESVQKMEV